MQVPQCQSDDVVCWQVAKHQLLKLCVFSSSHRYSSNIGLLLLNKWMLSGFGFRRPVFLTLW